MENLSIKPTMMAPLSGTTVPSDANMFIPTGVCAKQIIFSVQDNRLESVSFTGGCDGNLKGISALVKGMELEEIIAKLRGITCGKKSTSCPDQLSRALQEYLDKK